MSNIGTLERPFYGHAARRFGANQGLPGERSRGKIAPKKRLGFCIELVSSCGVRIALHRWAGVAMEVFADGRQSR